MDYQCQQQNLFQNNFFETNNSHLTNAAWRVSFKGLGGKLKIERLRVERLEQIRSERGNAVGRSGTVCMELSNRIQTMASAHSIKNILC